MVCGLCQQRHPGHEAKGFDKCLETKTALEMLAIDMPERQLRAQRSPGIGFEFLDHIVSLRYYAAMKTHAPSLHHIETLARTAMANLPDLFRQHLAHVVLKVEDFPDETVIAEMGLESEWDILGLYWGRHVGMKGDVPTGALPDMIFLYRQPLLAAWCEGEDSLEALVTHVLVHEVGHHFGLSDEAMDRIAASG